MGPSRLIRPWRVGRCSLAVALLLGLAPGAAAQATTLVSVNSQGVQGNSWHTGPAISADGRFVAFLSLSDNLVSGDSNGVSDLFVRDLQVGSTIRANVSSLGTEANGPVQGNAIPSLSSDGRVVVFDSEATNLVPGDTNGVSDVFVHDLWTGETRRVSVDSYGVQANRASRRGAISPDGRFVGFESLASNLVPGDTNGVQDIFLHDLATGRTSRVSLDSSGVEANGGSYQASVSVEGRIVAFSSVASNLVAGDTNGASDVFAHDRFTGQTSRVSVATDGSQANGSSGATWRAISADGRYIAFGSDASNLVAGDTNGWSDAFVHDRLTGQTKRVSISSSGLQGNHQCYAPSIAHGGRFVCFTSDASSLVPGDTNFAPDEFRHDLMTGETVLVSLAWNGAQGDNVSGGGAISADGRFVSFHSAANNLVPGKANPGPDVFLRDLGPPASPMPFCPGDGTQAPCPCSNNTSLLWHGCDNSAATGGAQLNWSGSSTLSSDTLVLLSTDELPTALTVFLQSSDRISPSPFGDGLLCLASPILRLYVKTALAGTATAPQSGDLTITARCQALGSPIPLGATRHYQAWYRDPDPSFCAFPAGNTWNSSSGLSFTWSP